MEPICDYERQKRSRFVNRVTLMVALPVIAVLAGIEEAYFVVRDLGEALLTGEDWW